MFKLCFLLSIFIPMVFVLDSNENAAAHKLRDKSLHIDRITINHVMKNAHYQPKSRYNLGHTNGRILSSKLQRHIKRSQSTETINLDFINGVTNHNENENLVGNIGSVHTLKDLLKYHTASLITPTSEDNTQIRNISISNIPLNVSSIDSEFKEFNSINGSGRYKPNLHSKNSTTVQSNNKNEDVTKSSRSLNDVKKVDKITSAENYNEIMVIEIPIKSSKLKDKNILLDITGASAGPWKDQDAIVKEIEGRIEKKICACFQQFQQDMVRYMTNIIGDKAAGKAATIISDISTIKKALISKDEETTTCGQCSSSLEILTSANNVKNKQITPRSLQHNSNVENELLNILQTNQTIASKDILALYDIDLKHPKQIFLVPKDLFAKLHHGSKDITQIHPTGKPMDALQHLTDQRRKFKTNDGSEDLLEDISSHRLQSRLYAVQHFRKNSSEKSDLNSTCT